MKIFGVLSASRGAVFELGAAASYTLGWILGARYFSLALVAFAAAVAVLAIGARREEDRKRARFGVALVSAAFVLPALLVLGQWKMDLVDRERFRSYRTEHRCDYTGDTVVGMSKGGCRFEECVDPEPIEDQEFFCVATGKHITLTDFKEGSYGR